MFSVSEYKARKALPPAERFRMRCPVCLQPEFSCYCRFTEPFDPGIDFVILVHPVEMRRRIATGRMSFLCLKRARMFRGAEFGDHAEINAILENSENQCMVLYPGPHSVNLTDDGGPAPGLIDPKRRLVVFVIDGTWATAKKMMRLSKNIADLPQICFTPPGPSRFRVRKQPAENCYSTIEAVHQTIELLGPACGFDTAARAHDTLLGVFDRMVEHQLAFVLRAREHPEFSHFRANWKR